MEGLLQTDMVLELLVPELVVTAGHSLVLDLRWYSNMAELRRMDMAVECFLVVRVSRVVGTGCSALDIRTRQVQDASLSPHSRTLLALGKALAAAVKKRKVPKKRKVVVIRWFDGQIVVTVGAVSTTTQSLIDLCALVSRFNCVVAVALIGC